MEFTITKQSRPFSAGGYSQGKPIGSSCPIILKHQFKSEFETIQSTFPQNKMELGKMLERPQSAGFADLLTGVTRKKSLKSSKSSTSAKSFATLEFLESLRKENLGNSSNLKPKMAIKADQLHSIIYKVKKQKEELDKKINELDNVRNEFSENEVLTMADSRKIDFILQFNPKVSQYNNASKPIIYEHHEDDDDLQDNPKSNSNNSLDNINSRYDNKKLTFTTHGRPESSKSKKNQKYISTDTKQITKKIEKYMDNINGSMRPSSAKDRTLSNEQNSKSNVNDLMIDNKPDDHDKILENQDGVILNPSETVHVIHVRPSSARNPFKKKGSLKQLKDTCVMHPDMLLKKGDEVLLEGKAISFTSSLPKLKQVIQETIPTSNFATEKSNQEFSNVLSPKTAIQDFMFQKRPGSAKTGSGIFISSHVSGLNSSKNNTSRSRPQTASVKRETATQTFSNKNKSGVKNIVFDAKYFDSTTMGLIDKAIENLGDEKGNIMGNSSIKK